MPRPHKWRQVCHMPGCDKFGPLAGPAAGTITMTVDEYESIRLIDLENCSQEECASRMNIARTTVQGIYNSARQKLAAALVNGLTLSIIGGSYKLCDGRIPSCCRKATGNCPYYTTSQKGANQHE